MLTHNKQFFTALLIVLAHNNCFATKTRLKTISAQPQPAVSTQQKQQKDVARNLAQLIIDYGDMHDTQRQLAILVLNAYTMPQGDELIALKKHMQTLNKALAIAKKLMETKEQATAQLCPEQQEVRHVTTPLKSTELVSHYINDMFAQIPTNQENLQEIEQWLNDLLIQKTTTLDETKLHDLNLRIQCVEKKIKTMQEDLQKTPVQRAQLWQDWKARGSKYNAYAMLATDATSPEQAQIEPALESRRSQAWKGLKLRTKAVALAFLCPETPEGWSPRKMV